MPTKFSKNSFDNFIFIFQWKLMDTVGTKLKWNSIDQLVIICFTVVLQVNIIVLNNCVSVWKVFDRLVQTNYYFFCITIFFQFYRFYFEFEYKIEDKPSYKFFLQSKLKISNIWLSKTYIYFQIQSTYEIYRLFLNEIQQ